MTEFTAELVAAPDHYPTALAVTWPAAIVGCSCGAIVQTFLDGTNPLYAWDEHRHATLEQAADEAITLTRGDL